MTIRNSLSGFSLICAVLMGTVVMSQSTELQLAQLVSERKGKMYDLQTHYLNILGQLNADAPDLMLVGAAASEMPELIDSFVPLMEEGTEKGVAPGSRARPELWDDFEVFEIAADALKEAALSMEEVAATGDVAAFKDEFDTLTAACTTCHGVRPSSGGLFRFEK